MRSELQPAVDVNEILSPWHKEILSKNAQKLYVAVWFKLHNSASTTAWMDDSEASRRARILIQFVSGAQAELARAGMLHLNPGLSQTGYEIVDAGAEYDHHS